MELGYFKGNIPNVGDELNPYLWDRLLPNVISSKNADLFIGIGSILDKRYEGDRKKIIFGAGARGENSVPVIDNTWDIKFVRGPLTSSLLKARDVNAKHITDPAILVHKLFKPAVLKQRTEVGLIPYFRTHHAPWKDIAEMLGARLISPSLPVDSFINFVSKCKFVITEAMHGAIISDSLRIPWIPFSSFSRVNEGATNSFKWNDWSLSMKVKCSLLKLPVFWPIERPSFSQLRKDWVKKKYVYQMIKRAVASNGYYLSQDAVFFNKLHMLVEETERLNAIYSDPR